MRQKMSKKINFQGLFFTEYVNYDFVEASTSTELLFFIFFFFLGFSEKKVELFF